MSFQKTFSKALILAQTRLSSWLRLEVTIVRTQSGWWNLSTLLYLGKNYFRGQYVGQNSLKNQKIYELSKELFNRFNLGPSATF